MVLKDQILALISTSRADTFTKVACLRVALVQLMLLEGGTTFDDLPTDPYLHYLRNDTEQLNYLVALAQDRVIERVRSELDNG